MDVLDRTDIDTSGRLGGNHKGHVPIELPCDDHLLLISTGEVRHENIDTWGPHVVFGDQSFGLGGYYKTTLEEILPAVDLVLIMSVNPGFGGQSYIPSSTAKIQRLRHLLTAIGSAARIEVDGGVKTSNVRQIVDAGVDNIVAGSAIFGGPKSVKENVQDFFKALAQTV